MMKRTNLVYPLLLASFSFLMVGCGYKAERVSQYEKQLPGVWVAQRLPEVEGISVEEYARNMLLLPTDTKSCIIYSFQRNGQVSYYPFVQERGVYIPGNKQEGRWAVRGNMLYIAHGTFPLLPMFEVAFVDSCLILRQTRQMQLDYLDATIRVCNERLGNRANQLEAFSCKTILAEAKDVQQRIARLSGDYTVSRSYTLRESEPMEENTDLELTVELPNKDQQPRYAE